MEVFKTYYIKQYVISYLEIKWMIGILINEYQWYKKIVEKCPVSHHLSAGLDWHLAIAGLRYDGWRPDLEQKNESPAVHNLKKLWLF